MQISLPLSLDTGRSTRLLCLLPVLFFTFLKFFETDSCLTSLDTLYHHWALSLDTIRLRKLKFRGVLLFERPKIAQSPWPTGEFQSLASHIQVSAYNKALVYVLLTAYAICPLLQPPPAWQSNMDLQLPTPSCFPAFPYDAPYDIQLDLMRHLYTSIEQRKVTIVESPTGTVSTRVLVLVGGIDWQGSIGQNVKSLVCIAYMAWRWKVACKERQDERDFRGERAGR